MQLMLVRCSSHLPRTLMDVSRPCRVRLMSAKTLVALYKCQLLLLVLGEGTSPVLPPVVRKPQTLTSVGAKVLVLVSVTCLTCRCPDVDGEVTRL